MLGAGGVGGDEGEVDLRLLRGGELDLRLLGGLLEALQRHAVLPQVDPLVALELRDEVVDHHVVEVVAAEVGVAVGRLHLERALADLEDRDVERAATEVVDGDRLVGLLVEPVRQRRRRRLVDDAQHVEARDLARVLGGLPLGVVEVGGDGDDRLGHPLAEVCLRVGF